MQKKNPGAALAIEFLLPGGGSIYADHIGGAVITWGLTIGGILVVLWGINQDPHLILADDGTSNTSTSNASSTAVIAGVLIVLGGRIHGLVDSWSSTTRYNSVLAQSLGLSGVSLTMTPLPAGRSLAWGPALSFQF